MGDAAHEHMCFFPTFQISNADLHETLGGFSIVHAVRLDIASPPLGLDFSSYLSLSPQLPLFVRPRSSRLASLEEFSW